MTNERMALLELVEKEAEADLVREMLAFAAERLMELEVEAVKGVSKDAHSFLRKRNLNGYRERGWAKNRAAAAMLKTIFAQENKTAAVERWDNVADAVRAKHPKIGKLMDASRKDVLAYMSLPKEHRLQIASSASTAK